MRRKTFEEASRSWMSERGKIVKSTSMAAYSLIIEKHLSPRFTWLSEITPESVQALSDQELRNGRSPTTVKGIILVLKMIIRYCERQGWMKERRYDVISPKRKKKSDPQVLEVEEQRRLITWLLEHPSPKMVPPFFYCMA